MGIKRLFFFFTLLSIGSLSLTKAESKELYYLSGTDNENTKTWEFFCTAGRNSGVWTTIEVPSHWEQQGFGEYDYGRDYRTYGKKFRFNEETGIYKHSFDVPAEWEGKEIFIVFEGSMTDTKVEINGELAGPIHQGSFYLFKYNISDKLKYGATNELVATVNKMSANNSVNRAERYADYWVFGGIFRPVYLEIQPKQFIERVAVAANAKGEFAMDVYAYNLTAKSTLEAEITDAKGNLIEKCSAKIKANDTVATLTCKVEDALLWTPETPNLYKVNVKLVQGGEVLSETSDKFGFRTIEIRQGDGVYVNNVQVKLKGVNRHVFWPETGRCVNPKIDLDDVKLMKSMNMNAVRCAHYPPDQTFLDYCDSLGLFVLDELAGWQNAYDTESGSKLVREMVIRDVNHPSILFWSNGNEGGTNKELDDDFYLYDPSKRPVIHAHHKPGNDHNGIDCNHYETYYSSKKILDAGLIYMPTEFLHSQDDGGGAAGLGDFWELFWNSPRSAGGFTWVLSDEGIVRTDLDGIIDVNRVNAPDGIVGPHREKEGSYYAMREIYSPVKIRLDELPEDFNGEIAVENRYLYTNLNECTFEYQLVDYYMPWTRDKGHEVKASGEVSSPDVPATEKGTLTINLPSDYQNHDALYLKAIDPFGNEIFTWSWKINNCKRSMKNIVSIDLTEEEKEEISKLQAEGVEEDNILPIEQQQGGSTKAVGKVTFTEDEKVVTLKGSDIAVSFSKEDGTIQSVTNDMGLPIPFNNGPVLVSGESELTGYKDYESGDAHVLEMNYSGDLKQVIWKMYNSGWLEMKYSYKVEAPKQLFTGISFNFPESDIIAARWLGEGPSHVWKNRQEGGILDVYERLYNNVLPATNNWNYPQFKGYYKDVSWVEFNTVDGKFTVVSKEDDLFLRLFDFYGISGAQNYPLLPKGNISFLDGIPPVGTKLAMGISNRTWDLGPAGELNTMDEEVTRTLYFYFGLITE